MQNIIVTVIIPTYNYEKYILSAVESINNQTYPSNLIEIIIIDDGSTDGTEVLIKKHENPIRIKYHYQQNQGKAAATQKGIDLSCGDIIFNLDADDYFYPQKIQLVVDIYQKYPEVVHVGHAAKFVYGNKISTEMEELPAAISDQPIEGLFLLEYFLKNRLLFGGGSTFSAKKEILKKNLIPIQVDMYIDEYLIFATAAYGKSYLLREPLSVWRIHGSNYSVNKDRNALFCKKERLNKSSKACLDFFTNQSVYTKKINDLYYLKHLDRILSSKEAHHEKSLTDIYHLFKIILSGKFSLHYLVKYKLINRLLPSSLIRILKKIKSSIKLVC